MPARNDGGGEGKPLAYSAALRARQNAGLEKGRRVRLHCECRVGEAVVLDVEVSQPIEALARHGREGLYDAAWLMVRIFDEPVGLVRIPFATGADRLDAPSIARAITEECGDIVASRVRDAGGDADSVLAGAGTDIAAQPAFLASHDRWIREGPEITVAILG